MDRVVANQTHARMERNMSVDRSTLAQRRADDEKFDAASTLVRAYNNYSKVLRTYPMFSKQEEDAHKELILAQKQYSRIRAK
jgi:hypothetical protein